MDANSWGQEVGRTVYFSTGPGCVGSGELSYSPGTLNGAAPLGGTDTGSLQICNSGPCPLSWMLNWDQTTPALAVTGYDPGTLVMTKEQIAMLEAVNRGEKISINMEERGGANQLDAQGGPDAFGYTWIDSDEPDGPVYNWVEINGIGSLVGVTFDDQAVSVALPFGFTFYGITYNSVNVSSNGNLHFGTANSTWSNTTIPSASAPLAMIAPFWDDLYPPAGGGIYSYYDAPNSRFIVEWDDIRHYSGTTGDIYNFQVILYATGRIVIQYETQTLGTYGLTSATIGLNNETGTTGLQVVFDAAYLHGNMAIQFQAGAEDWLTITPPVSGSVDPGECVDVPLTFTAGDLPLGTYTGDLELTSSDPDELFQAIPVSFVVGQLDAPIDVTIRYNKQTNTLEFNWTATNAPWYHLFSSSEPDGALTTLEGSTTGTSLSIPYGGQSKLFYVVVPSMTP